MTAAGVLVGCLLISGCGGNREAADLKDPDTLTRRQKDSIVSTLPVPGAEAVGKALDAADAARARAEQHDTIG
jgi:hypothetical protein